ncbi:MAG: hypothetical protein ACTS3R_04645 [Inquilinaceae bacterium]
MTPTAERPTAETAAVTLTGLSTSQINGCAGRPAESIVNIESGSRTLVYHSTDPERADPALYCRTLLDVRGETITAVRFRNADGSPRQDIGQCAPVVPACL